MHRLSMPRLGQTMEEGRLEAWLIEPGVDFAAGQALYEVETEKVTTSVEATRPGRLVRVVVTADSTVAVGELLAVVADPGEEVSDAEVESFLASVGIDPSQSSARQAGDDAPIAPLAATSTPVSGGIRAMPRTRAMARELGVDLAAIPGSGPQGRIVPADVTAAAAGAVAPVRDPDGDEDLLERRPLSAVHRRMAQAVARSWATVPQFTQMVDVDVSGWTGRRSAWGHGGDVPITFTDLVIDAVVQSATSVPEVNSRFEGDHLAMPRDVNVGLAVDSPAGLVVPVLKGLRGMSIAGRARQREQVVARAREGLLTVDDLSGGTITVSNLGGHGVQAGVPLLVEPYTAIVFIGAATERVMPRHGGLAIRTVCTVSIAFDHRVVDGVTAARFTSALSRALEY